MIYFVKKVTIIRKGVYMLPTSIYSRCFDVRAFLSNLPKGTVIIFNACSDDRTPNENHRLYLKICAAAPNAHVKPIMIPGAAHGLMDLSPEFEIERKFLAKKINLLTKKAASVVFVSCVHELCLDYDTSKSRQELNELMIEEIENLPMSLEPIVGDKLLGVIVLQTFLDEPGEEVDSTKVIGGMSTKGN